MAHKIRISTQIEQSAAPGAIVVTGGTGEQGYLPIGTTGQLLAVNAAADSLEYIAAPTGITNLAYTAAPTDGTVTSSSGTDATIPLVDATNAGLVAPADKTKLDNITVTQPVDLDALETHSDNLVTTLGVAATSTDMGVFPGTTITDNANLRQTLIDLETAIEAIPDAETFFTADIAARDALTVQTSDIAYVSDASADATVNAGGAMYMYDGTNWVKMAEFESMDVTNSFTLAADAGTAEVVDGGETVTIAGGDGITTAVAAANTVTVNIDEVVDTFTPTDAATDVTLSATPVSTPKVYRNGILQELGAANDYTIAGTTVTFTTAFGGSTNGSTGFERVTVVYFQ